MTDTTTTNLGLIKPEKGSGGWSEKIHTDLDTIDTSIGGLNSTIDDLPYVERQTGTFNSTTGDELTLGRSVDATNEYTVKVTPTSRAGAIGDIWVTKTTTTATIKCAEANTTDTFEATIYYVGDVSSYGGSIYRRYYVSPSISITDHSVAGTTGSLAYIISEMGGNDGIIELPGNRTYTVTANDVTIPAGTRVLFQPGAEISIASGKTVTFPSPYSIIAGKEQNLFTGNGSIAFTAPGAASVHWTGATGDGVTDDSDAIQAMIDAFDSNTGGKVLLLYKTYKANVTLKEYVSLVGEAHITGYGSAGGYSFTKRPRMVANTYGAIIDTPVAYTNYCSVIGVEVVGLGASTQNVGIHFRCVNWGHIKYCAFDNISDQAILHEAGAACTITNNMAINSLMDRTHSSKIGVFEISGTDDYIQHNEISVSMSSESLASGNLYLCAMYVSDPGANHFISNNVCEFGEIGMYVDSPQNKIIGNRCDRNLAHGMMFSGTNGKRNAVVGNHGYGNSEDTTNTYYHFYCGGSENLFCGNFGDSNSTGLGFQTKYGFYDDNSLLSPSDVELRNTYIGNRSLGDGTKWFESYYPGYSNNPINGSNGIKVASDGDTTPSVANCKILQFNNSSTTYVNDLDDGNNGDIVYLFTVDYPPVTVLRHQSGIFNTANAGDVTMKYGVMYGYVLNHGVWYSMSQTTMYGTDKTVVGADSTGTNVFSSNANTLGSNTGFYEISPNIYVPYWTNIEPT